MAQMIRGMKSIRGNTFVQPKILTLRDYYDKRNKILILRETGGLGDILMHRMMFEDFKKVSEGMKIVFACPPDYHDAVRDHPFVDELVDSQTINQYDYTVSFNTTTACGLYEGRIAPLSNLNRSDIWSQHCGVKLESHDMHITITKEEREYAKKTLHDLKVKHGGLGLPSVVVCPVSAMLTKNLDRDQLGGVLDGLRKRGFFTYCLNKSPIEEVLSLKGVMVSGTTIRQWMSLIDVADYAITVDTSAFHCRGGLHRPQVGIFSFADGKVYGKYYRNWELVQKHRDNGDWTCGPCYYWSNCPKPSDGNRKPCITEIKSQEVLAAFDRLVEKHPTA
jgi:ADP-heptose:LPS heptosyltransferase